jgi:hypothetical protein
LAWSRLRAGEPLQRRSPEELDGEFRISFILPRPLDNDEAKFVPGSWGRIKAVFD